MLYGFLGLCDESLGWDVDEIVGLMECGEGHIGGREYVIGDRVIGERE